MAAFKDERLYKVACEEVSGLGCPTSKEGLEAIISQGPKPNSTLEYAGEYIKLRMKVIPKGETNKDFENIAIQALTNDLKSREKVYVAENLLRRIVKSGSNGENFKAKAKEQYKLAVSFM